jgi:hypothetical protein
MGAQVNEFKGIYMVSHGALMLTASHLSVFLNKSILAEDGRNRWEEWESCEQWERVITNQSSLLREDGNFRVIRKVFSHDSHDSHDSHNSQGF